jgi:hypothetical protein
MKSQESSTVPKQRRPVDVLQVTSGIGEHIDRFPALWMRRDGSLLLAYQEISGRNRFTGSGCHVILSSTDDGRTWHEERRVFSWSKGTENASAGHAASPGDYCRFTALPDGRLVYHGQAPGGGMLALSREEFRDDPARWEIIRPTYDTARPSRCLYHLRVLPDGAWAMFGTWQERFDDTKERQQDWHRGLNRGGLDFLLSRDEGRTWSTVSTLHEGTWFPYMLCEPSWAIMPDGSYRVFTREDLGHGPGVEFTSSDQGRTWTARAMRFMGHHIFADTLPGGQGLLACYRVCHYIHMPAVGAWWDDGSPWGRFLLLDNISTGERYHADVSQWVPMPDGAFMVAYSLPPTHDSEVRVRTARFSLDSFQAPGT